MPTQSDIGEPVYEGRRISSTCRLYDASLGPERLHQWQMARSTTTTTSFFTVARHRNLSGPCCTGTPRPITLDNRALATPPPGVPGSRCDRESRGEREHVSHHHSKEGSSSSGGRHLGSHRKLDRSLSDSEDRINGNGRGGVNSSRYKTELCRPFEESGHCKYGDKCQFAHGAHELRNLTRHPKYKTERCRTYHTIGFCPYGPRCHFIHEENLDNHRKTYTRPSGGGGKPSSPFILPHASNTLLAAAHRPSNLSGLNSLGSSFESVSSSSTPGNLSPSHVEDQFPPIGTFSPSDVSSTLALSDADSDAVSAGTVFNFPASDAASLGSILTPLNIQTQQMYSNVIDMAALARFSAVLNISQNQHNNQSSYSNLNVRKGNQQHHQDVVFEPEISATLENCSWPQGQTVPPSSNSPLSLSDDSMGSNGSLESNGPQSKLDNAQQLINSPHDVGRAMRLPIFNKFSTEIDS